MLCGLPCVICDNLQATVCLETRTLLTFSSWRRAWASEASDDSDGVDDVPLHLGGAASAMRHAPLHAGGGAGWSRPGTRGGAGMGDGGSVVVGGGTGRMLVNYGKAEGAVGDKALPSILAAGAAMAGDAAALLITTVRQFHCFPPALGYEGGMGGDDILAYVKALRQQHRDKAM